MSAVSSPRAYQALGEVSETVMELYGLLRLLSARHVGSQPLRDSLLAAVAGLERAFLANDALFSVWADAEPSASPLGQVIGPLHETTKDTLQKLSATLSRVRGERMRAKLRLELERALRQLGSVLERQRRLWEQLLGCAFPAPILLRCTDVLVGGFSVRPSFSPRRVSLVVQDPTMPQFRAEPRVVALLLDVALQALGEETAQLEVVAGEGEVGIRISAGDGTKPPNQILELATATVPEWRLAEAVAVQAGIGVQRSNASMVLRLTEAC